MKSPLVSILIPAFNAQDWIAETIRSALGQTWGNTEIIVVDDGSGDQTLAIARRFAGKTVEIVAQPHSGASAARNNALARAQGDHIQWLDADDILAPDKIASQMTVVEDRQNPRLLLSSAWSVFRRRPDKAKFMPSPLWEDLDPVEWIIRKLATGAWMGIESWLVSRTVSDRAGLWDARLSRDQDGEYFCRIVAASEKVLFVPAAKCYCRRANVRSVSSARNVTDSKKESILLSSTLQIACLLGLEDSPRTRAAGLNELQRWMIYFYPESPHLVRRAEDFARELGGRLGPPRLSWKYIWIKEILGWAAAKRSHQAMSNLKSLAVSCWDRLEETLEGRRT